MLRFVSWCVLCVECFEYTRHTKCDLLSGVSVFFSFLCFFVSSGSCCSSVSSATCFPASQVFFSFLSFFLFQVARYFFVSSGSSGSSVSSGTCSSASNVFSFFVSSSFCKYCVKWDLLFGV